MTSHLGEIPVVLVLFLVVVSGQFAGPRAAFGQEQSSQRRQSATTPGTSARDYNQRLQELAQRNARPNDTSARSDYRIGSEDLLEVSVYGVPDLDRTVRVSAEGWISLPLAGDIQAEGLTTRELEGQIEGLLQKNYMTHPQVNVFLREIQSHSVSVIGAVEKPGVFEIREPKSLIEVLSMAQGLADDAGESVIVARHREEPSVAAVRSIGTGPTSIGLPSPTLDESRRSASPSESGEDLRVSLKDLLASTDTRYNVMVYPGDVVKVPQAGIVYVVGQVRKPGGFLLKTNQSLSVLQALALAEGTTSTSAGKRARIIRAEGKSGPRQEIAINLNQILAGKAPDPVLQAEADVAARGPCPQKSGTEKCREGV